MCEYCEENKEIDAYLGVVKVINNELDIDFYGDSGGFEINFCPMCGRDLHEQSE